MSNASDIYSYYQDLANKYDVDRFANTYGKFIHKQEEEILTNWLKGKPEHEVLDIACGTGRLLAFAKFGLDISENMLSIAGEKFPDRILKKGSADNLPFTDKTFSAAFSFHLFMHLDKEMSQSILSEASRIIKDNGTLIFDIPSKKRRQLSSRKDPNWHGSNAFKIDEIKKITKKNWIIEDIKGVVFLPIHRIPKRIRRLFMSIDNFLCRSFLKEYSSYLVFRLRKK